MKPLTILVAMAVLISMSVTTFAQDKRKGNNVQTVSRKDVYNNMNLPYQAVYSSQFVLGNRQYAKVVLQAWKDYENNTLDNTANYLVDSMVLILADGMVVKGRDNIINGMKAMRGSFSSVKVYMDAWIPTKSLDQNKETVCVWAREIDQKADGTEQKAFIHELWYFNKDGKVDMMQQFVEALK